ncbi:hypothetical protein SLEP1_g57754 [Rubroshorea leprosula]|uniref:Uncharacterized protein n=1 Tax=Rubroshorea leprosula TaxID=152421 RepID=A0AAV5MMC9_9ROSI|nr:hypothetical protein SLEP1_g57754 [Rubroshorea leprosula]
MAFLVQPIMELVKYMGRSTCTYLDYHLNFDEAMSDLRRELQVLNRRKEDINLSIQSEAGWRKEVKHEVQGWLEHVQEFNNELQAIQEKIQRVKWYSKGRLGKLVCKKIEMVKIIYEQGSFADGLIVTIDRSPTRGIILPTENVVGEDFAKEKIWGYLMGNEVGKIGVCGIGGVGKTTIMKHIYNELLRVTDFDRVIWVTVSYPLNVSKLQENIARAVVLDDRKGLRGGGDKERQASELMSLMEEVRSVLIVDDVWEKFSLKEVGIPEPTTQNGSKIVIISRSIEVCQRMGSESMKGEDDVKVWNNALTELREQMHYVVRDMAIKSIGPESGYMVKAGMKLIEVPNERGWGNDLKKVSLMLNNISKIPLGLCPKCPTLSTLILSNNYKLLEIPESFFEGMPELKVLDLSNTNIEALPDSISNLEKLSSLRLKWCKRLRYLPSLAKLRALKKLDLYSSKIEVVPEGMEKLISLEYLDLSNCYNLKEIPMGMLSNLSNLQYLLVYGELKIKGEEIARLSKLETFEGVFYDIQGYNYFVNSQDFQILTDYKIVVGDQFSGIDQKKPVVNINNCDLGEECIVLPDNLQNLVIEECKNMRSSLNKAVLLEKTTELSYCVIRDCEDMKCVVHLDSSSCPVLEKIEELFLWYLPKLSVLMRVEGVATPLHVFSNLKMLRVWFCSRLRKLFPLELLQAFQNLEEIDVYWCKQLKEIIALSDSDASSDKFTFPKLRRLLLSNLPQLKNICSAKRVVVCDSVEEIKMLKCPELKRIPVQLPLLDNGQPSPLPRLKEIQIDEESKEWWESVEWDHKNLLQPFLKYI